MTNSDNYKLGLLYSIYIWGESGSPMAH
jgi:hypothetical protein